MSVGKKYYVVFKYKGSEEDHVLFDNWPACQKYISGRRCVSFASFKTIDEAHQAMRAGSLPAYRELAGLEKRALWRKKACLPAIAVDAACSGCPGPTEYRGVLLPECSEIFHSVVHANGTNNIGEFLGIVKGLEWLAERSFFETLSLYSDSEVAIGWVMRLGRCNTKLPNENICPSLRIELAAAEEWLKTHSHSIPMHRIIKKWDTEAWGEIPADFGRK